MLKVALTGGIATGKSYVLDRFRGHGVPCLDADVLAHGVAEAGTEATTAIAARFGPAILAAGRLGRPHGARPPSFSPTKPRGASSKRSSIRPSIDAIAAGLASFRADGLAACGRRCAAALRDGPRARFRPRHRHRLSVDQQLQRLLARGWRSRRQSAVLARNCRPKTRQRAPTT